MLPQPGVQNVDIQAGFVSRNRQGILLTARNGPKTKLSNVTFSHVSVTQARGCLLLRGRAAWAPSKAGTWDWTVPRAPGRLPITSPTPFPASTPAQDNINSIVYNSADASGSLFENVVVRVNFEVMGECRAIMTAGASAAVRAHPCKGATGQR